MIWKEKWMKKNSWKHIFVISELHASRSVIHEIDMEHNSITRNSASDRCKNLTRDHTEQRKAVDVFLLERHDKGSYELVTLRRLLTSHQKARSNPCCGGVLGPEGRTSSRRRRLRTKSRLQTAANAQASFSWNSPTKDDRQRWVRQWSKMNALFWYRALLNCVVQYWQGNSYILNEERLAACSHT